MDWDSLRLKGKGRLWQEEEIPNSTIAFQHIMVLCPTLTSTWKHGGGVREREESHLSHSFTTTKCN